MSRSNAKALLAAALCALLAGGCARRSEPDAPQPARHPAAENRAEADQEATRSFAQDDPRVASGVARNKEAYEHQGTDKAPVAAPRQ
jgi:hypothetical protein